MAEIPAEWRELVGPAGSGSATAMLLNALPTQPIFSSDDACAVLDAPRSSVFTAINRLHDAGILRPLTDRRRDQIWGATAILDELDDLSTRIAHASR
jgi:hypothetical protein